MPQQIERLTPQDSRVRRTLLRGRRGSRVQAERGAAQLYRFRLKLPDAAHAAVAKQPSARGIVAAPTAFRKSGQSPWLQPIWNCDANTVSMKSRSA